MLHVAMTNPNEFLYARVKDLIDGGGGRQANILADISSVEECYINHTSDVGCCQYQHIGMSAQHQHQHLTQTTCFSNTHITLTNSH